MKKVFFLTLFLMIFGAASVKAQVRIGGNGAPHGAAVLDLNADDTNNGTKTLALPRVRLTSTADKMGNTALLGGMLVYNTAGGSLSEGVYYWDGSQWVKPNSTAYTESASIKLNGTSFERAALTGDVTAAANSNVTTIGDGKVTSAKIEDGTIATVDLKDKAVATAKIADDAVTNQKIANNAVTGNKISTMSASSGQVLTFDGSTWAPAMASAGAPGAKNTGGYITVAYSGATVPDAIPSNCRIKPATGSSGDGAYFIKNSATYGWTEGTAAYATAVPSQSSTDAFGVFCVLRTCWMGYDGTKFYNGQGVMAIPVICW